MRHGIEDFLNIKTAWVQNFSPDASKVLVQSNLTGTMQLYKVPRAGGALDQITDFEEPVSGVYLPTSDEILVQIDEGGNERLQIYLLDDESGANPRKVVYDPEYIHRFGGVTRDGGSIAYACNRRNGVDFDVYVRSLKSDHERLVLDIGGWCQPEGFSPDGRFLAVGRLTEKPGDNDTYLVDLTTDEVSLITPHDDEAHFGAPYWLPDSSAFFFSTDVEREFQAIARYDMSEQSHELVLETEWDSSCSIDWTGRHLLVAQNENGYMKLTLHDPATLKVRQTVELPGRGMAAPTFSRDGRCIAYSYTSFVEPGDVWLYDIETQKTQRLTESPNPVANEEFVDPEVHDLESFDGETIHTFLGRPKNFEGEKPPVIAIVHGGPEGQSTAIFNPIAQYFLHRGYAVVVPNVRGSTGYGKRYQHLDDVKKRLDSVHDLEALHRWMGSAGLDTDRAVLYGGSYGGYMVLSGLAFQPQLWAGGIDIVGISSLVTFLENTAAWRRKFREREYGSLEKDREFLEEISPITHVGQIRAPLFIIHGRNDPRVPVGEAEQIHKVLTEKGIPTEIVIYEDEGHGLQKLKNRLDAFPKAVDFLDRVLPQ
jgi:dipeptidyl aminopeptidase/acylaminoacyl peptidase